MNYIDAINKVLEHEGGFVNDPKDPGGATNFGITKAVYEKWKGRAVTVDEIKKMPRADAIAIYKKQYWDAVSGDQLKSYNIAFSLFDQAVNRGVSASVKTAQKVLGLPQDGKMGSGTLGALNSSNEKNFLNSYLLECENAYKAIIEKNPGLEKFRTGWLNRVSSIAEYVSANPGATTAASSVVIFAILFFFIIQFNSRKAILA